MVQQVFSTHDRAIGYVALGSNLGSGTRTPRDILQDAVKAMDERGFDVTSQSGYISSPAFPPGAGPAYANAVVEIWTEMPPDMVLDHLHAIEAAFGRLRDARWSARILDLDLLALGDLVLPDRATHDRWAAMPLERQRTDWPDQLILPHPRLAERAFVLVPLAEIAPDWVHPVTGRTARDMRDALGSDDLGCVTPL